MSGEGVGRGSTRERVEAALRKAERGEPLTETELTIVHWVNSPGGCHACGGGHGGVRVAVWKGAER